MEDEQIVIRAQLVEGWLNFEPMERVTHVGESSPMSVLSAEFGRVVATRTWTLETGRANIYSGASVCRGCPLTGGQEAGERVLALRWTGGAGADASESGGHTYRLAVEGDARP